MVKKLVNVVLIGFSAAVILVVTSLFYLGSRETFERDLAQAPIGFFIGRTFFGIVIGCLACLIVLLANLVLERGKEGRGRRISRLLLLTFAVCSASSLIGTLLFFFF